jgi:hypothetical protein
MFLNPLPIRQITSFVEGFLLKAWDLGEAILLISDEIGS